MLFMSQSGLEILERADDEPRPARTTFTTGSTSAQEAGSVRPSAAGIPATEIERITQSKRRAAWALFTGALLFLAANIVVQLVQTIRMGTGVGIGDGMPAGDGRAQPLVPQAIAGYNEAHTADSILHETGLMLAWFVGCILIVWGYYALLSRLRAA
jgi:hypothetical protein